MASKAREGLLLVKGPRNKPLPEYLGRLPPGPYAQICSALAKDAQKGDVAVAFADSEVDLDLFAAAVEQIPWEITWPVKVEDETLLLLTADDDAHWTDLPLSEALLDALRNVYKGRQVGLGSLDRAPPLTLADVETRRTDGTSFLWGPLLLVLTAQRRPYGWSQLYRPQKSFEDLVRLMALQCHRAGLAGAAGAYWAHARDRPLGVRGWGDGLLVQHKGKQLAAFRKTYVDDVLGAGGEPPGAYLFPPRPVARKARAEDAERPAEKLTPPSKRPRTEAKPRMDRMAAGSEGSEQEASGLARATMRIPAYYATLAAVFPMSRSTALLGGVAVALEAHRSNDLPAPNAAHPSAVLHVFRWLTEHGPLASMATAPRPTLTVPSVLRQTLVLGNEIEILQALWLAPYAPALTGAVLAARLRCWETENLGTALQAALRFDAAPKPCLEADVLTQLDVLLRELELLPGYPELLRESLALAAATRVRLQEAWAYYRCLCSDEAAPAMGVFAKMVLAKLIQGAPTQLALKS